MLWKIASSLWSNPQRNPRGKVSYRIYTIQKPDKTLEITGGQACQFASHFIRDKDLLSRMSELFLVDLYVYCQEFGVAPGQIIQEIEGMEAGGSTKRGTKPAEPFTREALKGLWHKHFFSALFMAENLRIGLGKGRLRKLVSEALDPSNAKPGETHEEYADRVSRELATQTVNETLDLRRGGGKLTGEWIVFARHEGKNYYLSLNTHKDGDPYIRARIIEFCLEEFPFIYGILETPLG